MSNDHPDSKLFPHATGAAAEMVKEHAREESLKLYSGWVINHMVHLRTVTDTSSSVLLCKGPYWSSWRKISHFNTLKSVFSSLCLDMHLIVLGESIPQNRISPHAQPSRSCPNSRI